MRYILLLATLLSLFLITGCMQKQPLSPHRHTISDTNMSTEFINDKDFTPQDIKIAMILPSKIIGRYAHSTSTAIFAYLLARQHPFQFKTFQIKDESLKEMQRVVKRIDAEGYHYIIAPLTQKGADQLTHIESSSTIYIPTLHKDSASAPSAHIFYGAIDYRAQLNALMPYASFPLVVMYDTSAQGKRLKKMTIDAYSQINHQKGGLEYKNVYSYGVDKKRTNIKAYLKDNKKIQNGSFVLNTPFIKSTMILSQLSVYDVEIDNALSTQINYDPLLFSMTQKKVRQKLYIANSINRHNDLITLDNALLSNDIVYDWINYTSTVGADLFYHLMSGERRLYNLPIHNQQVTYPISIVHPTASRFSKAN